MRARVPVADQSGDEYASKPRAWDGKMQQQPWMGPTRAAKCHTFPVASSAAKQRRAEELSLGCRVGKEVECVLSELGFL